MVTIPIFFLHVSVSNVFNDFTLCFSLVSSNILNKYTLVLFFLIVFYGINVYSLGDFTINSIWEFFISFLFNMNLCVYNQL